MIDLRLGKWQKVLADVESVDAVVVDPPYSRRTHEGHNAGLVGPDNNRREISYSHWGRGEISNFLDIMLPKCRGWFVCLSDSPLIEIWRDEFEGRGLTGFQPVPCVIPGMTVRFSGDGPSSWTIYANVARPKSFCKWGTLPGAYYGNPYRGVAMRIGGKPAWLMQSLIRDYTKPGDLVCDPCAGSGTTLISAAIEGRRSIGAEMDPKTYALAKKRIERGYTPVLPGMEAF